MQGTKNIATACLRRGVRRLVHVSSVAVYDLVGLPKNVPITESWRLDPYPAKRGNYTRSKIDAEQIITSYVSQGLSCIVIRPGLIYGPRGPLFPADVGYLVREKIAMLVGLGFRTLPLVYVENVVDALIRAAEFTGTSGKTFHVVDDETMTQREYVRWLARATGRHLFTLPVPVSLVLAGIMPLEWISAVSGHSDITPLTRYRLLSSARVKHFDTSKAKALLGWKPNIGLREGLQRTAENLRSLPHIQS